MLLVLVPIKYPTNVKVLWENLKPIASFDYLKIFKADTTLKWFKFQTEEIEELTI